jgi:hypothetical protein
MQDPTPTIAVPESTTTNSPSFDSNAPIGKQIKIESTKEKVDRLYLRPLRKLNEHDDGFVVLMIVLVLLEKALRVKHNMDETADFHASHKAFDDIGNLLEVNKRQAYRFWQMFRNGLLHRALPKQTMDLGYELNKSGAPLKRVGDRLHVDAIALKDVVMQYIENESFWDKDEFAFLPDTFEPITGKAAVQIESSSENPT